MPARPGRRFETMSQQARKTDKPEKERTVETKAIENQVPDSDRELAEALTGAADRLRETWSTNVESPEARASLSAASLMERAAKRLGEGS